LQGKEGGKKVRLKEGRVDNQSSPSPITRVENQKPKKASPGVFNNLAFQRKSGRLRLKTHQTGRESGRGIAPLTKSNQRKKTNHKKPNPTPHTNPSEKSPVKMERGKKRLRVNSNCEFWRALWQICLPVSPAISSELEGAKKLRLA